MEPSPYSLRPKFWSFPLPWDTPSNRKTPGRENLGTILFFMQPHEVSHSSASLTGRHLPPLLKHTGPSLLQKVTDDTIQSRCRLASNLHVVCICFLTSQNTSKPSSILELLGVHRPSCLTRVMSVSWTPSDWLDKGFNCKPGDT